MTGRRSGFTFVELMVVILIMSILSTGVVLSLMHWPGRAKVARAKADIGQLEIALEEYRGDNGYYPTEQQGLDALIRQPATPPVSQNYKEGGYLKRTPMDPWKRNYVYSVSESDNKSYEIMSYGRDGEPGGTGEDADISSLEL